MIYNRQVALLKSIELDFSLFGTIISIRITKEYIKRLVVDVKEVNYDLDTLNNQIVYIEKYNY
jgi:hypothetical protein